MNKNLFKRKLVRNRCKCALCGDVIESKTDYDFVFCKCGSIAVDGGLSYAKRTGEPQNIIEMAEWEATVK